MGRETKLDSGLTVRSGRAAVRFRLARSVPVDDVAGVEEITISGLLGVAAAQRGAVSGWPLASTGIAA